MNGEIETITATSESMALTVIKSALPAILAADQNDILGTLAAKVKAHKPDISTPKGRDEIRSLAAEVASSKVALIKLGKSLTENWRKQTKAVNEECNIIEEKMDALKMQVRQPLTEFENAEKARVAAHEKALQELVSFGLIPAGWPSEHIATRIEELEASEFKTRNWQEFQQRASDTYASLRDTLANLHAIAVNREAKEAEEARRRAIEAERERQAAIQAQKEREERIAAEAAERARIEAEARAKREAEAIAQETERQARQMREVAAAAQARAEKAEADRIAAEQRAARDAAEAEAKAQRERDAAIKAERQRLAAAEAAEKAESERRAANVAHQKKINREARDAIEAIVDAGFKAARSESEKPIETAQAIVVALAKGLIPHCKVIY